MNWYKIAQLNKLSRGSSKHPKWKEVEENKKTIQDMLDEGYSQVALAQLFEINVPLFRKMLNHFNISKDKEVYKQKAIDLLNQGVPITEIAKRLRTQSVELKKILGIPVRKINRRKSKPISDIERQKIINLHTEENLRPTEISKIVGRPLSSVKTVLEKAEVYQRLRGDWVRFNPTPEEIQKIDHWYNLPPNGEGRSLVWVAQQFNIPDQTLGQWFRKTGRKTRTHIEQQQTEYSRGETSTQKILEWEEKGGLEGYLKTSPKDKAISFLNGFLFRVSKDNPQRAMNIYNKYMQIIENANNIPQTEPQLATV